jgi:hypothetical protein
VRRLGELARDAPEEASELVPELTNSRVALAFGASTEQLTGQFWHFVTGELDAAGWPTGLRFTEPQVFLDLLRATPPHFPMRASVDVGTALCGQGTPFAEHLDEISLPIFYVGAEGGFGADAARTMTRTSSGDTRQLVVPDFGHADLLLAETARMHAWDPIVAWLREHPVGER